MLRHSHDELGFARGPGCPPVVVATTLTMLVVVAMDAVLGMVLCLAVTCVCDVDVAHACHAPRRVAMMWPTAIVLLGSGVVLLLALGLSVSLCIHCLFNAGSCCSLVESQPT